MLTDKNYGKHSKYSRYSSQIKPTDPESWNYSIDEGLWPAAVPDNIRILSINCLRFPKTYYSLKILANLIMSSNCDVAILQEISTTSMMRDLLSFINKFLDSDVYSFVPGRDSITNLQLVTFYKKSTWTFYKRETLELNDSTNIYPFPRDPFSLQLMGDSFDIDITNVHFPSHSYVDSAQRIDSCFSNLGAYFNWSPINTLLLVGGDFNTDTASILFSDYLSDFQLDFKTYHSNSDIILFHKDNLGSIIQPGFIQYSWNYQTYMNLTPTEWLLYFSDHKPIILDLPI